MARYFRTERPQLSQDQRIDRLLKTWADICAALAREISVLHFELPDRSRLKFAADLKPYEEELDALISAWVSACVLEGRAEPLGNDDCAIWVPIKPSGAMQD
jgi:hypothetical protein